MAFFNVDFPTLGRQLLPVLWRKPVHKAWVLSLLQPIITVHELFMRFRADNLYFIVHTSQVCYMEAALNDMFDASDRRIYIVDGTFYDPEWLYLTPEDNPVWLKEESEGTVPYPDVALYTDAETEEFAASFVVMVPTSLTFDIYQMKALIDRYRLPGKTYLIETF